VLAETYRKIGAAHVNTRPPSAPHRTRLGSPQRRAFLWPVLLFRNIEPQPLIQVIEKRALYRCLLRRGELWVGHENDIEERGRESSSPSCVSRWRWCHQRPQ
jgi:hypothetical protein